MNVQIKWIGGHIEVYDNAGKFLFSTDNAQEAMKELQAG